MDFIDWWNDCFNFYFWFIYFSKFRVVLNAGETVVMEVLSMESGRNLWEKKNKLMYVYQIPHWVFFQKTLLILFDSIKEKKLFNKKEDEERLEILRKQKQEKTKGDGKR